MLKKKINRVTIDLTLRAVDPILVKEGDQAKDRHDKRDGDDKENKLRFLRTHKGDGEPYIPGSSIKGVLRQQAEKIINLLSSDNPLACDPLAANGAEEELSCSAKLEKRKKEKDGELDERPYNLSCPICKIFGNQFTKSRITFEDAYLTETSKQRLAEQLPTRDGAPINRFVGSNNNLFSYEYIENKNFVTTITLENFELWQLGLLSFLLRDLYAEEIKIGFGTARGLGRVRGIVDQMKFDYYNPAVTLQQDQELKLLGINQLDSSDNYAYAAQEELVCELENIATGNSLFPEAIIENNKSNLEESDVWTLLQAVADKFSLEEIKNA